MSRRAAARLESFGLENICVYVAGKQDWLAFDLPFDGKLAESRTAGSSAMKDIPVCAPLEKISEVRRRAEQAGWHECVVADDKRVVLGLLEKAAWHARDELTVEEVMDPAPLTLRPHFPWESVVQKMNSQKTAVALVTRPDGKLIGLLRQTETKRPASKNF
jgi:CBS domain-containing protein